MLYKKIRLERVNSTNAWISEALKRGELREEVAIVADYQEEGRGQGDHMWESPVRENLLMSVLLFPAFLAASRQFHLSRVASLAISDLLTSMGLEPEIKWPNDILVKRRKIAGILIENGISGQYLSYSIVGTGLNINQSQFP